MLLKRTNAITYSNVLKLCIPMRFPHLLFFNHRFWIRCQKETNNFHIRCSFMCNNTPRDWKNIEKGYVDTSCCDWNRFHKVDSEAFFFFRLFLCFLIGYPRFNSVPHIHLRIFNFDMSQWLLIFSILALIKRFVYQSRLNVVQFHWYL